MIELFRYQIPKKKYFLAFFLFLIIILIALFKIKTFFYNSTIIHDNIIKVLVSIITIFAALRINQMLRLKIIIPFITKDKRIFPDILIFFLFPLYIFLISFKFIYLQASFTDIFIVIIGTLFAAGAEEFIFRFFCVNYLSEKYVSPMALCIMTSFVFAVAHFGNLQYGSMLSVINQVIFAFFTGVILFLAALRFRCLLVSVIIHFVVNIPTQLSYIANTTDEIIKSNGSTFSRFLITQLVFLPIFILSVYLFNKLRTKNSLRN